MSGRRRRLLTILAILIPLALLVWRGKDWIAARIDLVVLESDSRVEGLQIDRVIAALEIGSGYRVADIGAGTGIFTRPLASAVGDAGIVYAVDINSELLRHIERTAAQGGHENIRTILVAGDDPQIPETVDLIFICDTLHHIDERDAYLRGLRTYLRPSGRIAVIDFEADSPHIFPSLKYSRQSLRSWMEGAGYRFVESFDFVADNFFLVYRCESCPEPL